MQYNTMHRAKCKTTKSTAHVSVFIHHRKIRQTGQLSVEADMYCEKISLDKYPPSINQLRITFLVSY